MDHREAIVALRQFLSTQILGQDRLIERLLIALLADGHLLVEGAPGLAKTRAIKELAGGLEAEFHRIQFTPDLLPADITGTEIYRPETGSFVFQQGPIFHNLVLADEINRAPAKVQSALLEAMAERQVSVGRSTYDLSPLFLVMATQNPIEHEGTYPLPEAQLDRFLLHVRLGFPDASVERRILQQARGEAIHGETLPEHRVSQQSIFAARKEILDLYMADAVEEYLVQLVMATRTPAKFDAELAGWIAYGASPRGSIALDRFLLHVKLGFPDASVERRILQQARGEAINGESTPEHRVSQQAIFAARKEILGLYMADAVEEYLVQLVMATRTPAKFDSDLAEWIAYGASPRGTISLDRCARAHAWLAGRDFVSPEDIQAMFFDVLRHRLILSFEAEAAGIDQDRVLQRILDVVAVA